MQPVSPSLANVDRIVIVCPSWVGDCVMATPVYRAMRQMLPKAKIVAVVRKGLDEVLHGCPWFDDIVVSDMKGLLGPLRLAKAIRGDGTGAPPVLLLPNSFRAALGARLSRSRLRIGYERDGRGWLLTHKLAPPASKAPISAVNYYAALGAFALNVSADAIDHRLELGITESQRKRADELLGDVKADFILLNPGANRADKRWPAERFACVADTLATSHGLSIVVNGSPKEHDIINGIIRHAKTPLIDLSKRGGTLGSLKAVIASAKLVITNDTGPRHIAAALGTPVVTLFGPTDHRWTTLQGAQERILLAEPFLPEQLIADRHAKACAIEKISVKDVVIAAESLLRARQAREAATGKI
jgi:heptosyltransferase II